MYKFSIVVPCYNLEGLIRKCLMSIINQPFSNYELIVVNDKSTDSSLRVIKDISSNHRITILDLENNVGLGHARNAGLNQAVGEYVIFIDGDDEIESDLLTTLNDKIDTCNADIVVYNHYREWVTGRQRINIRTDVLESLSEVGNSFNDNENKIKLFSNFNVAWNKAYKKSFLVENNLKFTKGYYEDIPFNYASIILANSISVVSYAGYKYRQREGSILNSKSDKHKDIIDQYEHLFSIMDEINVNSEMKSCIYKIFVNHIYVLLFKERARLSCLAEKEIIIGARRLINSIVEFHLLDGIESYKLIYIKNVNTNINEVVSILRSFLVKVKSKSNVKTKLSMRCKLFVYKYLFLRLPILSDVAVFESYWGRSYNCNPKSISDYISKNSDLKVIWFGKKKNKFDFNSNNETYVQIKTLKYFYYLARAKYIINNANFPNFYVKRTGSIYLQTKHGTPLKVMGNDELINKRKTTGYFKSLFNRCSNWDYVISSNEYSTEKWRQSFPNSYKFIESGYPRNDYLYNNKNDLEVVMNIKRTLNIPFDKKVILLCPTFREYHYIPNYYLNFERFSKDLSDDYVVIVRAHYFKNHNSGLSVLSSYENIIDVTLYPNIEELYLVSDLLVTDYSSTMFDYANLKRPIILYTPDYHEYETKRGVYFDIRKRLLTCSASTQGELLDVINKELFFSNDYQKQLNTFYSEFCSFDDGFATQRVCKEVFDIK